MQKFTGLQYLMIDVANSFGLDTKTWSERLQWFSDHRVQIETDSLENIQKMAHEAEEPAQFFAGVNAYRRAVLGLKTGYTCKLDATASGIQLLSVLSGCEQSARMCNLVNTGKREDAYTATYQHLNQALGSNTQYRRKDVKGATMTHFFGSKAEPKKTFGEDTPELAQFYNTVDELLPGANQLNYDLIGLWQSDALSHDWTLPDGFDTHIKVMVTQEHSFMFLDQEHVTFERVNQAKDFGLSNGANIIHSIDGMVVREMGRRCDFDPEMLLQIYDNILFKKGDTSTLRDKDIALLRVLELADQSQFMSAVVFEYLDEYNQGHLTPAHIGLIRDLIESLPAKPFKILAIHDCFRFLPNYGNDVREQYINILAELANSEILSSIATQITGKHTPVNKLSQGLASLIYQSEYALS